MYLPWARILNYLLTMWTKNSKQFFDNVRFGTCVKRVRYDKGSKKIVVNLSNREGKSSSSFDVCSWEAVENIQPYVPSRVDNIPKCQGFWGRVMHSSQMDSNFDLYVRGKNDVIIGASSLAKDLALMAIKLGTRCMDIVSRSRDGNTCKTTSWPMDKVCVYKQKTHVDVANGGHGVVLARTELDPKEVEYVTEEGGILTTLEDVATVVYCTGYKQNFNMLSEEFGDVPPNEINPAPAVSLFSCLSPGKDLIVTKKCHFTDTFQFCTPRLFRTTCIMDA